MWKQELRLLGVSIAIPGGPLLGIMKVVGGAFLVFLAIDGFRGASQPIANAPTSTQLPPAARGALAVILNPPAWLFLATAASSLMVSATRAGGTGTAVLSAMGLLVGVAAGDGTLVVASGLGLRRANAETGRLVRRLLAIVLGLLGVSLVLSAFVTLSA